MESSDPALLSERQQYWLKHIRACKASGKTTIDYARAHGINVKSMYSASKALVARGTLPRPQPIRFQKAQVPNGRIHTDNQWRIQLPNGVAVTFAGEMDAATLSLVLNTAASVS